MEWVVKTVQEVTKITLALDTFNIAAMEAGLKVHKGKALINSIMARPERMDGMMPLVRKHDAYMIGLLWGPEGMPGMSRNAACLLLKFWPRPRNMIFPMKISGSIPLLLRSTSSSSN